MMHDTIESCSNYSMFVSHNNQPTINVYKSIKLFNYSIVIFHSLFEKGITMRFAYTLSLLILTGYIGFTQTVAARTNEDTKKGMNSLKVEFSTNRIHGLFNFLQAISDQGAWQSPSIKEIFQSSEYNNEVAQQKLSLFVRSNLNLIYDLETGTPYRPARRQIWQLFVMKATQSNSLEDFKERTFGLISNKDHEKIFTALQYFEPIYEKLIWKPEVANLKGLISRASARAKEVEFNQSFAKVLNFFDADWDLSVPFKVYFSPIPNDSGYAVATPQGNILTFSTTSALSTDEQLSIVFHEMVHILFENQSISIKQNLERRFLESRLPTKSHAYHLLDEALATSIGNGWFYKSLMGELDKDDWYATPYINGQAKAIYSLIEKYLTSGRTIDDAFVDEYLALHSEKFPKSHLEITNLFANTSVLASDKIMNHEMLYPMYFNNFNFLRSIETFSPLTNYSDVSKHFQQLSTRILLISSKAELEDIKVSFNHKKNDKIDLNYKSGVIHYYQDSQGVMNFTIMIEKLEDYERAMIELKEIEYLPNTIGQIDF